MGGPILKSRLLILPVAIVVLSSPNLFAQSTSLSVQCDEQYPGAADLSIVVYPIEQADATSCEEQGSEPGCLVSGFSGYFHPQRWRTCLTSGDSGVDVTGAPIPKLLVEGTNSDLMEVADVVCRDFSILIPADGYLSFKWEELGSSLSHLSTGTTSFTFSVNGENQTLLIDKHRFASSFLRKGDRISFSLSSDALHSVVIRDFTFLNNSNTSFLGIIIPAQVDLYLKDLSQLEQMIDPYLVGQPYIDADGLESTLDERQPLLEMSSQLHISWEDYFTHDEDGTTLVIREWFIYDPCGGNEIRQQQRLRCFIKTIHDR
jgi:hypothetical protein